MKTYLTIEFGRKFKLDFRIRSHSLAQTWAERLEQRHNYTLDDPRRFYGFGNKQEQEVDALRRIQEDIDTINQYQPIVERQLLSVTDQDTLNYLHNIFERYHGLLNQQNSEWWAMAPVTVQQALARLNIDVHRCETVSRGGPARFVCTWWNMPKIYRMSAEEIVEFGELNYQFGGVYINYAEVGKTLEDLMMDNDQYIGDDAFQPMQTYSADFNVRFYDRQSDVDACANYYHQHQQFFKDRGIDSPTHPYVMPYRFKVAELVTDLSREQIIAVLSDKQEVTNIQLS